jgi:hypothetical protein
MGTEMPLRIVSNSLKPLSTNSVAVTLKEKKKPI